VRGWRREVEALVGPVAAPSGAVIRLAGGVIWWRRADAATPILAADREERSAATTLPFDDGSLAWSALSFVGDASRPDVRRALLGEVARVLAPGAVLAVIDHNRPRRRAAALAATIRPPRPRPRSVRGAWRRLAYPTAREVSASGFIIDRLSLVAGERVQVVVAHRPTAR